MSDTVQTRGSKTILCRVFVAMIAATGCAFADTIDLSSGNTFTLAHGQQLTLRFSVWNYAANNPGSSPYPTSIGLELVGANPASGLAPVPNSNADFFSGYLLHGTLESLDGTASVALDSSVAASMGLADGSLVVTPGMYYGNGSSVAAATIQANAAFSMIMSEQIFGPAVASRQSSALIVLQNLGSDLVIGLGNGNLLRSAFAEPSVTGLGGVQTSGITQSVSVVQNSVPEPATLALLISAIAAIALLGARLRPRTQN